MKHTHIHTFRHTPPFSQSAYTYRNDLTLIPKNKNKIKIPGIMLSLSNQNVKTLKLNKNR